MSKPFEIVATENVWAVLWGTFPASLFKRQTLLQVVFDQVKCDRAQLLVRLNNNEMDTLNVDFSVFAQDKSNMYSTYLQHNYDISGVVFTNEKQANVFYDWVEREYVWKKLKE